MTKGTLRRALAVPIPAGLFGAPPAGAASTDPNHTVPDLEGGA